MLSQNKVVLPRGIFQIYPALTNLDSMPSRAPNKTQNTFIDLTFDLFDILLFQFSKTICIQQ